MKLLIYSHFFAPSVGGVETVVLSLARGLSALRSPDGTPEFEITLATETAGGTFDDSSLPFQVVRQIPLLRLWDLVRASDLTHVAGPALAPLCLCFLARRPLVVEHHGYQAVCPNGLLLHRPDDCICPGHFLGRNYRECVSCLKQETSPSRSWARLLLEFPRNFFVRRAAANLAVSNHSLNRCALPNSAVVYHGIEDPPENGARPELASSSGEVCFAYVGRLVSEKGIPVLLEASRLLRDEGHSFLVRLIGDGPERSRLEAIIARDRLESCVQLTGFLTGAALAETLRDLRVVVMPSVWEETAGLAAIEQMMRGRLVIASAIGGLCEVVGSGGLTFPAGDARALALQMSSVLQNPSIIDTLGSKARDRALELFRRGPMIDEHARLYRKVVHDRES
jgi:glycogen synthase